MGESELCALFGWGAVAVAVYAVIAALRRNSSKDTSSETARRFGDLEAELIALRARQQRLERRLSELEQRGVAAAPDAQRPSQGQVPDPTQPMAHAPPPIMAPIAEPGPRPLPKEFLNPMVRPQPSSAFIPSPTEASPPPAASPIADPNLGSSPEEAPDAIDAAPPPAAPPAAPSPPPEPEPEYPKAPAIEWERWLGVRGAAVLGGCVLAFAGLLFFRYAVEAGIITPPIRVALAVFAGLGSLVWSERMREKYPPTANGVSAAGIVILYAAFWALHARYQLAPLGVSFALMALTTVTCCLLSVRYSSQLIAILGLTGGFATPLLLSSGGNRPFALFSYVLLLDLGFLYVARRKGWAIVSWILLVASIGMELLWIGFKMEPGQLWIALSVLALFALVFAAAGKAESGGGFVTQALAILAPFFFVQYFAGDAKFGPHLYPVALFCLLLNLGAGYIARAQAKRLLANAAAAATVGIVIRYLLGHSLDSNLSWELALCAVGLAGAIHALAELEARAGALEIDNALAALVASGGMFLAFWLATIDAPQVPFSACVTGLCALAALALRQSVLLENTWLYPASAAGLAFGIALVEAGRGLHGASPTRYIALDFGLAIGFQLLALHYRKRSLRSGAEIAAAIVPLVFLLTSIPWLIGDAPKASLIHGVSFGFAYLAVLSAARLGKGAWLLAACVGLVFVHVVFTFEPGVHHDRPALALGLQLASVAFFMLWPFLQLERFRGDPFAWYGAALAGPMWFMSLRQLWTEAFGTGAIGLLPLLLAAGSVAALARARKVFDADDPRGKSNLAWLGAVALSFVSVAIPLQLDRQWITIGWALEAVAVTALWARLDHPGLKYFALALHSAVFARLVLNDSVLGYEPRGTLRIFNWLLYTYWVPGATMVGTAILLAKQEVERARDWENWSQKSALCAALEGFYAIIVFFVWINLAIADWFSSGRAVTLSFERMPARDLATSIAWAAYAILLLTIGVWRNLSALRWVSLCFLLLVIGKVFLYDLSHLKDLYRVMSLVGLAFSLLLVSIGYQRFVFKKKPEQERA